MSKLNVLMKDKKEEAVGFLSQMWCGFLSYMHLEARGRLVVLSSITTNLPPRTVYTQDLSAIWDAHLLFKKKISQRKYISLQDGSIVTFVSLF